MYQLESEVEMSENINNAEPRNIFGEPYEEVEINVDDEKGFYKCNGLNKHEISYLLKKGYKETSRKSCFSNVKKYLVKPRFNEGISHFFLIMDIANYLTSKNLDIKLFQTTHPDIIFGINGEKIAIEIETGKNLKNNKKQLIEKVKLLNENYDDWFFVLTNRNLNRKYSAYGQVVDKRYLKNYLEKLFLSKVCFY